MNLCRMWMEGLTPEMMKKAKTELGETHETKSEAMKKLKQLIQEEGDRFRPLMDDDFLLRFLRVKKYEAKSALKTLRNYYSYKAKHSGLITDITPREARKVLLANNLFLSPLRDLEGGAIIVLSLGTLDLSVATIEEVVAATLLVEDVALTCEATQVCGVSFVVDFAGMTTGLFLHFFRPSLLVKAFAPVLDTFPLRVKGFHAVHEISAVNVAYNTLCKPLLTKKLKTRVNFHGDNMESLHKFFPPESLPESLGGKLGVEDYDNFRAEIHSRQEQSEKLNKYTLDGKTYPAKPQKMWRTNSTSVD